MQISPQIAESQYFEAFVIGKDPQTQKTSALIKMHCHTSTPRYARISFDKRGKAVGAPLEISSSKIARTRIGKKRDQKQKSKLEITSQCQDPAPNTERICLPPNLYVSIFAPRTIDSHRSRSLFQIGGYEEVWIHDLNLTIIPDSRWNRLYEECTATPKICEAQYKKEIETMLKNDTIPIAKSIQNIFFVKSKLVNNGKFDCSGTGEADTPTSSSTWEMFQKKCTAPYTALWNYWKKKISLANHLRRMGSVFWLYDNQKIKIENNKIRGITANAMIRAQSNESIVIQNNILEGISAQQLLQHGVNILDREKGFSQATENTVIMGTGISILEGSHASSDFSCSDTARYKYAHRRYCERISKAPKTCLLDTDCQADERCVHLQCKSSLCDTQYVQIEGNTIRGCNLKHWGSYGTFNDDGIQLTSVSAIVQYNNIYHFSGCDSLVDIGHRGPCDIKTGEAHHTIKLENNIFAHGKVKTTGSAAGENVVHYLNNDFYDVRVSDYHQYWRSIYENNTWHISDASNQSYLWGEHAKIGSQP